jgi:hypothetical protein
VVASLFKIATMRSSSPLKLSASKGFENMVKENSIGGITIATNGKAFVKAWQ